MSDSTLLVLDPNDRSLVDAVRKVVVDESDMDGHTRVDQVHLIGVRRGKHGGLTAVGLETDKPRADLPVSPIADTLDHAARALIESGAALVTTGTPPDDRLFASISTESPSTKSAAAAAVIAPLVKERVPLTLKSSRHTVDRLPQPVLAVLGVTVTALLAGDRVTVEAVPAQLTTEQFARAAGITLADTQRRIRRGLEPVGKTDLHQPLFDRAAALEIRTSQLQAASVRQGAGVA